MADSANVETFHRQVTERIVMARKLCPIFSPQSNTLVKFESIFIRGPDSSFQSLDSFFSFSLALLVESGGLQ